METPKTLRAEFSRRYADNREAACVAYNDARAEQECCEQEAARGQLR
jgi:hypothetical protein